MRRRITYAFRVCLLFVIAGIWLPSQDCFSQSTNFKKFFRVKENVMYITLPKDLPLPSLDSFILSYNLSDAGLYTLLLTGTSDSLKKSGWELESKADEYTITKKIAYGTDLRKSADRMVFSAIPTPADWRIIGGNRVIYGVNRFKSNQIFKQENDITYFFLKGHPNARFVRLAGSFTNWQYGAFPMTKTENGWIAAVQLKPGQYFYKFIINENDWTTDSENFLRENDGRGNINSVYFIPNKIFFLKGYQSARTVFLSGSFNNWSKTDLLMEKTAEGWRLPMFLEEGTHDYHYIVDGKIVQQNETEAGGKVILGTPHVFELKGYSDAHKVSIAGDFNDWKPDDIFMQKTDFGWQVAYVLGPGNYQYKYVVDGNWVTDPSNPSVVHDTKGNLNSFMVVQPNYTFRLKGFETAKRVLLSGDFNNWSPQGLVMSKVGNEWVCSVYLGRGKHLYKFIVDGEWIRDPKNKLWEDESENSVLWIE